MDRWLRTRALSNHRKGSTAVLAVHDAGPVAGFTGLGPTAVVPGALPRSARAGRPSDAVPGLRLSQLATDRRRAGAGIGTGLLKHAPKRSVEAAALVGGRALLVNAVDESAAGFRRRRGFPPTRDDPFTLFRPLFDIAASLRR